MEGGWCVLTKALFCWWRSDIDFFVFKCLRKSSSKKVYIENGEESGSEGGKWYDNMHEDFVIFLVMISSRHQEQKKTEVVQCEEMRKEKEKQKVCERK